MVILYRLKVSGCCKVSSPVFPLPWYCYDCPATWMVSTTDWLVSVTCLQLAMWLVSFSPPGMKVGLWLVGLWQVGPQTTSPCLVSLTLLTIVLKSCGRLTTLTAFTFFLHDILAVLLLFMLQKLTFIFLDKVFRCRLDFQKFLIFEAPSLVISRGNWSGQVYCDYKAYMLSAVTMGFPGSSKTQSRKGLTLCTT